MFPWQLIPILTSFMKHTFLKIGLGYWSKPDSTGTTIRWAFQINCKIILIRVNYTYFTVTAIYLGRCNVKQLVSVTKCAGLYLFLLQTHTHAPWNTELVLLFIELLFWIDPVQVNIKPVLFLRCVDSLSAQTVFLFVYVLAWKWLKEAAVFSVEVVKGIHLYLNCCVLQLCDIFTQFALFTWSSYIN